MMECINFILTDNLPNENICTSIYRNSNNFNLFILDKTMNEVIDGIFKYEVSVLNKFTICNLLNLMPSFNVFDDLIYNNLKAQIFDDIKPKLDIMIKYKFNIYVENTKKDMIAFKFIIHLLITHDIKYTITNERKK